MDCNFFTFISYLLKLLIQVYDGVTKGEGAQVGEERGARPKGWDGFESPLYVMLTK